MSFGTSRAYESKKAFREAVESLGAENVFVYDTSMFDNRGEISVAQLVEVSGHSVVGPDPYTSRKWYAIAARKRDGSVTVK